MLLSADFDWASRLTEFGPSSRLFLWIHWKQAEAGKKLDLTVRQLSTSMGLNEKTIRDYSPRSAHEDGV